MGNDTAAADGPSAARSPLWIIVIGMAYLFAVVVLITWRLS
jgi:hypothetical protein